MRGKSWCSILSKRLNEGTMIPTVDVSTMIATAIEYVVSTLVVSIIHPPRTGASGMNIREPMASSELTLPRRC